MVRCLVYYWAVSHTKVSAESMCLQMNMDKSEICFRTFPKTIKIRYIEPTSTKRKNVKIKYTVQWPSWYIVWSIVELSVKPKSVLTQCACKRLRINLEFFSEPSKKRKKRLYWAYSQLKAASWLWHFSPNLCRQFLSEVRGLLCTVALDLKNLPWNCVKVTWYCYTYNFCILRKCK